MTITRAQARTRLRFLIDDPVVSNDNGVRTSKDDVEDALKTAQQEAYNLAVTSGANIFQTQGTVTTSSAGLASLTSLAPQRLVSVAIQQGNVRVPVPALRARDTQQLYTSAPETLVVTYVPRVTFPAADGDPFVWGSPSIDLPQLDKLMVAIAASELKIVDAEVLSGLETRKAELKAAIDSLCNVPRVTVFPLAPGRQIAVRYIMSGRDALQLVYA
jgi:hypothetical protein